MIAPAPFVVAEIGGRGGPSPRWRSVCPDYHAVLVDPDAIAKGPDRTVVESLLLDKPAESEFHLCNAPPLSSVHPPNLALLERLMRPEQVDAFRIRETRTFRAETLDTVAARVGIETVDFLRIDVEGAEFAVLKGGEGRVLPAVSGVEVEFAFLPIRFGQPPFRLIDELLTSAGFELYDLEKSYFLRKETAPYGRMKGQAIFGIALYFVPPEKLIDREGCSGRTILGALLSYLAYGYNDSAETLLRLAREKGISVPQERMVSGILDRRRKTVRLPMFAGREKLHRILAKITRSLGPEGKNLVDPGIGNWL